MVLVLASPPGLHPIPEAARPYVHLLRNEPEFVAWWIEHRDSVQPLTDFIDDPTASRRNRQRAWQARNKWRYRREEPYGTASHQSIQLVEGGK
jgi:hypothetical protein